MDHLIIQLEKIELWLNHELDNTYRLSVFLPAEATGNRSVNKF